MEYSLLAAAAELVKLVFLAATLLYLVLDLGARLRSLETKLDLLVQWNASGRRPPPGENGSRADPG